MVFEVWGPYSIVHKNLSIPSLSCLCCCCSTEIWGLQGLGNNHSCQRNNKILSQSCCCFTEKKISFPANPGKNHSCQSQTRTKYLALTNQIGKGHTGEGIICHWKKLDKQKADCWALSLEIEPASFTILQQIRNSTRLKGKTHMTTCVPSRPSISLAVTHWYSSKHNLEGTTHDLP